MKANLLKMVVLLMVAAALGSCVAKKKFIESENGRLSAEEQVRELTATVEAQNNKISELETTISGLETKITGLETKIAGLESKTAYLESDTARLGKEIRDMRKILTSNMTQREQMDAMLKSQKESLAEMEDKLREQSENLAEMEAMLKKQRETLVERESTINDLRAIIQKQNDMVNNLLRQVTDALTGFSSDELTVQMRDGKVYVAMSDKLLFTSGSADVDNRGKQALAMLAEVLTKQPEIDIFIEGHTDNVPMRSGGRFADNWDLSVIRATSVVRILTVDYKVNPLQIIPSGRSEFFPVADNSTPEGRSKNRRTEIILQPKLDKLFQMLNEYQNNW